MNDNEKIQTKKTENNLDSINKKPASELKEQRLKDINAKLSRPNNTPSNPEEIKKIQENREQEYQAAVEKIGIIPISEQDKAKIHDNLVGDVFENAKSEKEKFDSLMRLKKAAEILSPEDFLYFEKILGNKEGNIENLYNLKDKYLHTTNNYYFNKILESGSIKSGKSTGNGEYGTPGVSLARGNFPEVATFQTMTEDQNTYSSDKQFNSQKYDDKKKGLMRYFWDNDREGTKNYLNEVLEDLEKAKEKFSFESEIFGVPEIPDMGGISQEAVNSGFNREIPEIPEKPADRVKTFEDVLEVTKGFAVQTKPEGLTNEELSKLFAVTVVFNKNKLPYVREEDQKDIRGLQKHFEIRAYKEEGVPISDAVTVFVPESQMGNMKKILGEKGLKDIEIRPSEELEVIRMVKLLDKEKVNDTL